jgi:hypothetical protein
MSSCDPDGLSRRRFITSTVGAATAAGLATACGDGNGARAAPGGGQRASASPLADAVVEAFQTHRLVAIGEAHNLQNHHDALETLLSDSRLPGLVNDIVVECGDAFYQPMMDKFIAGRPVDNADLRRAWRNTTVSPMSTWDEPVYEQFFRTVRAANAALPPSKHMRVLLGDPPIDWAKVTNVRQISAFSRDGFAASIVEKKVLAKGRRALLIYGMVHLFHPVPKLRLTGNLVDLIQQRVSEQTYVIADLVPVAGDPGGLVRKLSGYPRNTVIPTDGTWLGSIDGGNLGALIVDRHGRITDGLCGVPLGSLIDAGLYLGQPADLTQSYWNPAIFLDPVYWAELQRRNKLQGYPVKLETYRREQPAGFPLINVAPCN